MGMVISTFLTRTINYDYSLCFKKHLTIFLFLLYPKKALELFLDISSIVLITKQIGRKDMSNIGVYRFNRGYCEQYEEAFANFSIYTLDWFWGKEYLDDVILVRGKEIKMKEFLSDLTLVKANINLVARSLISRLPYLLRVKLGLHHKSNYLKFKHKLMGTLNHCHSW